LTSRLFLNLHTNSTEMRRLHQPNKTPASGPRAYVLPNFAFIGSNMDDDVWDSKFTLTEVSRVHSFDIFGSSRFSRSILSNSSYSLDGDDEDLKEF
jgi:hypothetical protein